MNDHQTFSVSRAEFQVRVRQALLAAQHSMRQVALLLLSFHVETDSKVTSDTWQGNIINDSLNSLRSELRDSDVAMPLAENQIGIILPSISTRQDIEQVIERLTRGLKKWVIKKLDGATPAPCFGVAMYPEHGSDVSSLFQLAESALTEAMVNGRICQICSSEKGVTPNARQWMNELRHAIVSDQLCLLYQPKIKLSTGQLTGVEVLTRWRHPKLGTIVPDEFIPVAERTGLIVPLTLWVLQQALQQCRHWQDNGLDLTIAVNLTMWNLQTPELPEQIVALLRDTNLPASKLELEITESAIMGDPERTVHTLSEIRRLGVQCSIDDFGTGYSSFAYLKKLPVSCIKIDKSFVLKLDVDPDNAAIVKSIIDLGHNLSLKVIAEGIESSESKNLLQSFGCDEGQGYFFSPPLGAAAVAFYHAKLDGWERDNLHLKMDDHARLYVASEKNRTVSNANIHNYRRNGRVKTS
jgi:EAL domain-containing protein (putative c-di-GMP-specific phosphodiesterase class I)